MALAYVLEALTPKRAGQYYLYFHPDSDPSIEPLLDALDGVSSRVIRAMVDPARDGAHTTNTRVIACRAGSLTSYFHYLRSQYVLASHPMVGLSVPARRKTVAYIGHGMPAKRIGRLDGEEIRLFADHCLATSDVFRKPLADSFGLPPQTIYLDHSPRVEAMSAAATSDPWARLGIERRGYRAIAVWAPSFRGQANDTSGVRTGVLASTDLIGRLSKVCADNRCLLVIKRHPYERSPAIENVPHITEVAQETLDRLQVSLYEMLAGTDVLITDVSSVWIDFLVMDRPVLLFLPDLEEFTRDRGFILDPYEDWAPSPLLMDDDDFVEALAAVFQSGDRDAERRRRVAAALLPDLPPEGASRRLIQRMDAGGGGR